MAALQSVTAKAGGPESKNRRWSNIVGAAKPWSARRQLLGVDIGSTLIKVVLLSRKRDKIALKHAILSPTPAGVVTAGEMTNAITVADSLRRLYRENHFKTRHIAIAVSGDKVYAQLESLPKEFEEDVEDFVQDAMMKVIPYSIDRAAFDYERLPGTGDSGSAVLWVSSGFEQVEWVREAVTLAGKVPAVVDVQACALANAYVFNYQPPKHETVLLFHIGPRQMTMALMRGSLLICSRDATLGRENPVTAPSVITKLMLEELDRRLDLLLQQATPKDPGRLYVSGGAAQSVEVREALNQRLGMPVEDLNPFRAITVSPQTESGRMAADYRPALAVAVGLALRGFEDL